MTLRTRASFAQERLWFIESLDPESALYNELICYRIKGTVDAGMLGRSLDEVTRRHEALRTNLSVIEGQVFQSVFEPVPQALRHVDLASNERSLEAAGRMLLAEARKPFNLSSEALIRPILFRLGHDDYLLGLITHHTVMDGWSMNVLIKELSAIYENLTSGAHSGSALPPVPIQYRDYSVRQRNAFDSGVFDGQMAYWLKKLGGDLPVLQLPFDRPRPAIQSYSGRSFTVALPASMTIALKALGRKEKSTLFMVLLTAFYAQLYRYSGQEDIIVGCPIAGRNQIDIEGMIGLCVNTLALKCAIAPGQTFLDTLRQVRASTLEAYENQDLPFEKLVEKLSVQRSLDTPPVFQALFQLRNFASAGVVINGHPVERFELDEVMAKVDLTLEVTETKEGLSCRFEYPLALFDNDSIARMSSHWRNMLEDIISDPSKSISRLRMLDDRELSTLKGFSQGIVIDYPREGIPQIFEARVREAPETVAVIHGQERLTYHELNARAGLLAGQLKGSGVMPGDPVVIKMERSTGMVVAMLAVLKDGAVYVPIDPSDPADRIAGMLEAVRAKVVIDDKYVFKGLPESFDPCAGPDSPAYIMFTSGSTGKPKGVCIPHRGIVRLAINTDYIAIKPGDRISHLSNPAFDAATFEIWGALLNGGTLVIVDKDAALSPVKLKETIRNEHIDIMFMTTPLFQMMATEDPSMFHGVRELLVGGDVMEPGPAKEVLEHGPPGRLLNVYGPTENTTFSSYYHVKDVRGIAYNIPIGRTIANSSLYILDGELQPVPAGVTGEIFLGGDGVSMGYYERPDLTAAAFYPDPFNPGGMMYRTGDLGRYMADGNAQFIGRIDGQVKIRGFRVEAGEIVSALEEHPGVRKAVVTAYSGPDGAKTLAAYIVKAGDETVSVEEVRSYLFKKLPAQMIPSGIVWVDVIPLTSRGKVDYAALPMPSVNNDKDVTHYRRHDSRMDEHLSAMTSIWSETLGLPGILPDDDFFRLGGHSLLAIRLISRIEDSFNVRLPVSAVFKAPTARQMTFAVIGGHYDRNDQVLIMMQPGAGKPPLFCVHGVPGTLFDYDYIALLMGENRPVYGLQCPGLDGKSIPLKNVKEIVSRHIREVRCVQAHGPYNILAHCAAGAIAYEIACQLEASGEKTGFLGVIDYAAPKHDTNNVRYRRFVIDNIGGVKAHVIAFMQAGGGIKFKKAIGLPSFLVKKALRLRKELSPDMQAVPPSPYPDWIMLFSEPQRTVAMVNYDAINDYVPGPFAGKITAFISSEKADAHRLSGDPDSTLGWGKLVSGGVTIHVIEGDHESMKSARPAKDIVRIIRSILDV